jgi:hypothetical protein
MALQSRTGSKFCWDLGSVNIGPVNIGRVNIGPAPQLTRGGYEYAFRRLRHAKDATELKQQQGHWQRRVV